MNLKYFSGSSVVSTCFSFDSYIWATNPYKQNSYYNYQQNDQSIFSMVKYRWLKMSIFFEKMLKGIIIHIEYFT